MMFLVKVRWMPFYVGEDYIPNDSEGADGYLAEKYNFLRRPDGRYYGYLRPSRGERINVQRFAGAQDGVAVGVTVVFVSPAPGVRPQSLRVVGYYEDATVSAEPIRPPILIENDAPIRIVSNNAILIPESVRTFDISLAQPWLQGAYRWPDDETAGRIRQYIDYFNIGDEASDQREIAEANPTNIQEWIVSTSERRERRCSHELRAMKLTRLDDYQCSGCGWKLTERDHISRKRSFEVHHTEPVALLAVGEIREVNLNHLTVVCANCHRAIHATGEARYVHDLAAFRKEVLGIE